MPASATSRRTRPATVAWVKEASSPRNSRRDALRHGREPEVNWSGNFAVTRSSQRWRAKSHLNLAGSSSRGTSDNCRVRTSPGDSHLRSRTEVFGPRSRTSSQACCRSNVPNSRRPGRCRVHRGRHTPVSLPKAMVRSSPWITGCSGTHCTRSAESFRGAESRGAAGSERRGLFRGRSRDRRDRGGIGTWSSRADRTTGRRWSGRGWGVRGATSVRGAAVPSGCTQSGR